MNPVAEFAFRYVDWQCEKQYDPENGLPTINVSERIGEDAKKVISDMYPELSIRFGDTNGKEHAFGSALRAVNRHWLWETIMFNHPNSTYKDIGGDYHSHIARGRLGVHCCRPTLEGRDYSRGMTTTGIFSQSITDDKIISEWANSNENALCCSWTSEKCPFLCEIVVATDVYDLSIAQMAETLVRSRAKIGYFCVSIAPKLLLAGRDKMGTFLDGMTWNVITNNPDKPTFKCHSAGISDGYLHDYNDYIEWFHTGAVTVIDNDGLEKHFYIEMFDGRGSRTVLRLVEVGTARVDENHFRPIAGDATEVVIPELGANGTLVQNHMVPQSIYQQAVTQAMRNRLSMDAKPKSMDLLNALYSYMTSSVKRKVMSASLLEQDNSTVILEALLPLCHVALAIADQATANRKRDEANAVFTTSQRENLHEKYTATLILKSLVDVAATYIPTPLAGLRAHLIERLTLARQPTFVRQLSDIRMEKLAHARVQIDTPFPTDVMSPLTDLQIKMTAEMIPLWGVDDLVSTITCDPRILSKVKRRLLENLRRLPNFALAYAHAQDVRTQVYSHLAARVGMCLRINMWEADGKALLQELANHRESERQEFRCYGLDSADADLVSCIFGSVYRDMKALNTDSKQSEMRALLTKRMESHDPGTENWKTIGFRKVKPWHTVGTLFVLASTLYWTYHAPAPPYPFVKHSTEVAISFMRFPNVMSKVQNAVFKIASYYARAASISAMISSACDYGSTIGFSPMCLFNWIPDSYVPPEVVRPLCLCILCRHVDVRRTVVRGTIEYKGTTTRRRWIPALVGLIRLVPLPLPVLFTETVVCNVSLFVAQTDPICRDAPGAIAAGSRQYYENVAKDFLTILRGDHDLNDHNDNQSDTDSTARPPASNGGDCPRRRPSGRDSDDDDNNDDQPHQRPPIESGGATSNDGEEGPAREVAPIDEEAENNDKSPNHGAQERQRPIDNTEFPPSAPLRPRSRSLAVGDRTSDAYAPIRAQIVANSRPNPIVQIPVDPPIAGIRLSTISSVIRRISRDPRRNRVDRVNYLTRRLSCGAKTIKKKQKASYHAVSENVPEKEPIRPQSQSVPTPAPAIVEPKVHDEPDCLESDPVDPSKNQTEENLVGKDSKKPQDHNVPSTSTANNDSIVLNTPPKTQDPVVSTPSSANNDPNVLDGDSRRPQASVESTGKESREMVEERDSDVTSETSETSSADSEIEDRLESGGAQIGVHMRPIPASRSSKSAPTIVDENLSGVYIDEPFDPDDKDTIMTGSDGRIYNFGPTTARKIQLMEVMEALQSAAYGEGQRKNAFEFAAFASRNRIVYVGSAPGTGWKDIKNRMTVPPSVVECDVIDGTGIHSYAQLKTKLTMSAGVCDVIWDARPIRGEDQSTDEYWHQVQALQALTMTMINRAFDEKLIGRALIKFHTKLATVRPNRLHFSLRQFFYEGRTEGNEVRLFVPDWAPSSTIRRHPSDILSHWSAICREPLQITAQKQKKRFTDKISGPKVFPEMNKTYDISFSPTGASPTLEDLYRQTLRNENSFRRQCSLSGATPDESALNTFLRGQKLEPPVWLIPNVTNRTVIHDLLENEGWGVVRGITVNTNIVEVNHAPLGEVPSNVVIQCGFSPTSDLNVDLDLKHTNLHICAEGVSIYMAISVVVSLWGPNSIRRVSWESTRTHLNYPSATIHMNRVDGRLNSIALGCLAAVTNQTQNTEIIQKILCPRMVLELKWYGNYLTNTKTKNKESAVSDKARLRQWYQSVRSYHEGKRTIFVGDASVLLNDQQSTNLAYARAFQPLVNQSTVFVREDSKWIANTFQKQRDVTEEEKRVLEDTDYDTAVQKMRTIGSELHLWRKTDVSSGDGRCGPITFVDCAMKQFALNIPLSVVSEMIGYESLPKHWWTDDALALVAKTYRYNLLVIHQTRTSTEFRYHTNFKDADEIVMYATNNHFWSMSKSPYYKSEPMSIKSFTMAVFHSAPDTKLAVRVRDVETSPESHSSYSSETVEIRDARAPRRQNADSVVRSTHAHHRSEDPKPHSESNANTGHLSSALRALIMTEQPTQEPEPDEIPIDMIVDGGWATEEYGLMATQLKSEEAQIQMTRHSSHSRVRSESTTLAVRASRPWAPTPETGFILIGDVPTAVLDSLRRRLVPHDNVLVLYSKSAPPSQYNCKKLTRDLTGNEGLDFAQKHKTIEILSVYDATSGRKKDVPGEVALNIINDPSMTGRFVEGTLITNAWFYYSHYKNSRLKIKSASKPEVSTDRLALTSLVVTSAPKGANVATSLRAIHQYLAIHELWQTSVSNSSVRDKARDYLAAHAPKLVDLFPITLAAGATPHNLDNTDVHAVMLRHECLRYQHLATIDNIEINTDVLLEEMLNNSDTRRLSTEGLSPVEEYMKYTRTKIRGVIIELVKQVLTFKKMGAFAARDHESTATHAFSLRRRGNAYAMMANPGEDVTSIDVAMGPDFQLVVGLKKSNGIFECDRSDPDYLVAIDDSRLFQDLKKLPKYEMVEHHPSDARKTLHLGVPGCGKTAMIVEMARDGDLVLVAGREPAMDVDARIRQTGKRVVVRTIDSYVINGMSHFKRVIIDEGTMVHMGEIELIMRLSGCEELHIFGDQQQIPAYSRVPGLTFLRNKLNLNWFDDVQRSNVSHRVPAHICSMLNKVWPGITSTNRSSSIMDVRIIQGYQIPSGCSDHQMLVFTQIDKMEFQKQTTNVLTIGEAEGRTYRDVLIVVPRASKLPIYESQEHWNVALTRHTVRLTVALVGENKTFAKMYSSYNPSAQQQFVWRPNRLAAGSPIFQAPQAQIFETIETGTDRMKIANDLAAQLGIGHGLEILRRRYHHGIDPELTLKGGDYMSQKISKSLVAQTLQGIYDDFFPDRGGVDNRNDALLMEQADLEFNLPRTTIDPYKTGHEIYAQRHLCCFEVQARIMTTRYQDRPRTQLEQIITLDKRNLGATYKPKSCDDQSVVFDAMKNLIVLFRPDWREILPSYVAEKLQIEMNSLTDYVARQTLPKLGRAIKELRKVDVDSLNRYEMMPKQTPKADTEPGAELKYPALQNVIHHTPEINVLFGPLFAEVCWRLMNLLDSKVFFMIGRSISDLRQWVNSILPDDADVRFVNIDQSKFDKSQDRICMLSEYALNGLMGMSESCQELWYTAHEDIVATNFRDGVRTRLRWQRRTGDVSTAIGNSSVSMISLASCIDLKDALGVLVMGDDICVIYPADKVPVLQDYARIALNSFCLEAKASVSARGLFCNYYIYFSSGAWRVVNCPIRRMECLGRDYEKYSHYEMIQRFISFRSLVAEYADIGNIDDLTRCLVENYEKEPMTDVLISCLQTLATDFETYMSIYEPIGVKFDYRFDEKTVAAAMSTQKTIVRELL